MNQNERNDMYKGKAYLSCYGIDSKSKKYFGQYVEPIYILQTCKEVVLTIYKALFIVSFNQHSMKEWSTLERQLKSM